MSKGGDRVVPDINDNAYDKAPGHYEREVPNVAIPINKLKPDTAIKNCDGASRLVPVMESVILDSPGDTSRR